MNSKSQLGFSLVESLLEIVIVGIIVVLLANLPNALGLISKSKHISLAREIAAKQLEDERDIKYNKLVNGSSPIVDSRLSLLPQGSGTVIVSDCNSPICTNGEHIKQVTSIINWQDNSKLQTVNLETMIGERGLNQ